MENTKNKEEKISKEEERIIKSTLLRIIEEVEKETKEVTHWVCEDDVQIIINTICECQ